MFKDMTELAENKLILLYILNRIDMPVSNTHITQIILENNLINYFSLQQYLSELVDAGFVNDDREDKKHALSLTQKGKEVLDYFLTRIPDAKKEMLDEYLKRHLSGIIKDIEVVSEYEPCENDKYIVTLKLKDYDNTLLEIKMPVDSNSTSRRLCQMWKQDYNEIYNKIMSIFFDSQCEK